MFTTAVDKLLSQFFALSAEERSCILEVLVDSQPINNSDGVESFLSKRLDVSRSGRPAWSALRLIKSCKKRQTPWDSTLYMSRLQQKLWLEQRVLFQPLQERNFSMVPNTSSASWTGFLSESAHEGAEFPWIPLSSGAIGC